DLPAPRRGCLQPGLVQLRAVPVGGVVPVLVAVAEGQRHAQAVLQGRRTQAEGEDVPVRVAAGGHLHLVAADLHLAVDLTAAQVQAVRVAAQHEVPLGRPRLGAAGDRTGHVHIGDGPAVALVGDEGVLPGVLLRRWHAVPAPGRLGAQQRAGWAGWVAWRDRI